MELIGFTGLRGSGKDTAAAVFVEAGWRHIKMAGAIKAMLRTLLAYQGMDEDTVEIYVEGHLKEQPCAGLNGAAMRHALVTLGTEWGREMIHENIWIDITARACTLYPRVVISDIRFPNEVEMVHRLGGKVVRLTRGDRAPDDHSSERLVSGLAADVDVPNNFASADCLKAYIRARFLA